LFEVKHWISAARYIKEKRHKQTFVSLVVNRFFFPHVSGCGNPPSIAPVDDEPHHDHNRRNHQQKRNLRLQVVPHGLAMLNLQSLRVYR
jgi:hypothetical protein